MREPFFVPTPVADLFGDEDFRFKMGFTRGRPAGFFGPSPLPDRVAVIAERQRWLREAPETYSALLPEGEVLLDEVEALAITWSAFAVGSDAEPLERCRALGEFWEADFLLLTIGEGHEIRLAGGCLCFPSHWRLTDKLGEPMQFMHGPVPGLNESLGPVIVKFLRGLKPGLASQRVNWGLSRSPEYNQHPDRNLLRLDSGVGLAEVWLRVEEQALVALPESGGILFGIRIVNHPLASVIADSAVAKHLCRALETMPESMARYKGLAESRSHLLTLLRS